MSRNLNKVSARCIFVWVCFCLNVMALAAAVYTDALWLWLLSFALSITTIALQQMCSAPEVSANTCLAKQDENFSKN